MVVLALHETGGLVAMKQIPIGALEGGVKPLIAEMALLKDLNHPCISSYVTCAVSSSTFCIMTEYLPAGSLSALIQELTAHSTVHRGLSALAVCRYALSIADGLHYLHTRQPTVLHLDIKPENVLMTGDGSCKLIDFGTSKFFVEAQASTTVRGTPRYMAPEAAVGEAGPASDIYSVGITMLHMLLGHSPWTHIKGDDNAFIMRLIRQGDDMAPQMPTTCDPGIIALIHECISKNPADRPTAAQLRQRLSEFLITLSYAEQE